jgi:hypothetical protein
VKKKPFLVPIGVALAALFPAGAHAKVADTGASLGRAQISIVQSAQPAPELLALPASDPAMSPFGHYSHYSHTSHYSHQSHHSHYSSSGEGGHYSHSSHASHSSHYSSS